MGIIRSMIQDQCPINSPSHSVSTSSGRLTVNGSVQSTPSSTTSGAGAAVIASSMAMAILVKALSYP